MDKLKFNRVGRVLVQHEKSNRWLASALGVNENTVSRWVNNVVQPEIKTLFRIAALLGVEVGDLLEGNTTTNTTSTATATTTTAYLVELYDYHGNPLDVHLFRNLDSVAHYSDGVGIPWTTQHTQELEKANFVAVKNNVGVSKVSRMVLE